MKSNHYLKATYLKDNKMDRVLNAIMLGFGSGIGFYGFFWVLTSVVKVPENLALGILLISFIGGFYGLLEYLLNDLAVVVTRENNRSIEALGYIADKLNKS